MFLFHLSHPHNLVKHPQIQRLAHTSGKQIKLLLLVRRMGYRFCRFRPQALPLTEELRQPLDQFPAVKQAVEVRSPDVPLDTAFGLMHTIEKAAEIYMLARSAGGADFLQTIPDSGIRDIARDFGVTINEAFLNAE